MTRPTTIRVDGSPGQAINQIRMRRRVMAALLRHGADGVHGNCYCGSRTNHRPDHRAQMVATETGLDETYVREVLAEHRSAVGILGHEMHCCCDSVYDDSHRSYGREQHLAEAIAAGCSADMLHAADIARRSAQAGGAR